MKPRTFNLEIPRSGYHDDIVGPYTLKGAVRVAKSHVRARPGRPVTIVRNGLGRSIYHDLPYDYDLPIAVVRTDAYDRIWVDAYEPTLI